MAWVILKKDGKPSSKATRNWLFSDEEIDRLKKEGNHTYVMVNPVTLRRKTIRKKKKRR